MDQGEATRLEQLINREITGRFPPGTVQRATLVQDRDDPALEPDELLVRVFVIPADPADSAEEAPAAKAPLRPRRLPHRSCPRRV